MNAHDGRGPPLVGAAVIQIDEAELVCRMVESAYGIERPPGATPEEALRLADPDIVGRMRHAARAAILYVTQHAGAVEVIAP